MGAMKVQENPSYKEEKQHLDETLRCVDQFLASHPDAIGYGGDDRAAREARRVLLELVDQMREVKKQAYFGRVDFLPKQKSDLETFYVGQYHIPDTNVFSWADTLPADLYYLQTSSRSPGKLLLKRTFDIRGRDLRKINDEFVDPSLPEVFRQHVVQFTDALLFQLLSDPRGRQLRDIVATIQKRQYQIIQSPKDKLLIVQGATGSGKTSLALHRVAYLLYHYRDSRSFVPENLLILGPNRIFLGYIENVLPALGERHVPQSASDEWISDRLGGVIEYEPQEAALEDLLNPALPRATKAMRYRNAQTKGSLQMAALLDRYVDILHDQLLEGAAPFECTFVLPPGGGRVTARKVQTRWPPSQMKGVLDEVRHLPFNLRRDEFETLLVSRISRELVDQFAVDPFERKDLQKRIQESVRNQIDQHFKEWENLNVAVAYRRLLRTPRLLQEAGKGIFPSWDLELLNADAPTALIPFRFSDLAALLYLKQRLDGQDSLRYEHIVVDEAQDISPLHFKVLLGYSREASMTVLGDLAQRIYPHHGVSTWEDLICQVGENQRAKEIIRESYRSTREIVEFANALRRRTGTTEAELAEPIARSGPPPTLHSFNNRTARTQAIGELVADEHTHGWLSIAIICKTATSCQELAMELATEGFSDWQLIGNRRTRYEGRVAIIPSYLAKGLEFDAVIVADADAETYVPDELHARLLYVALSRAAHSLHVCWIGALTPLLDANQPSIELHSPLAESLQPRLVTIEEYVARHPHFDADWCVERLAGAGKLRLLADGQVDETLLEVILAGLRSSTRTPEDEVSIEPLSPDVEQGLHEQVRSLDGLLESAVQEALGSTQLIYGLLRNQMRGLGLAIPEDDHFPLAEQVVLLATLAKAVRGRGESLSIGRWTTAQHALDAVAGSRRVMAEKWLALLVDFGVVEEEMRAGRAWIRVPRESMSDLLELSLGHRPGSWEPDLLQRSPQLPSSLY